MHKTGRNERAENALVLWASLHPHKLNKQQQNSVFGHSESNRDQANLTALTKLILHDF